jgi:hypothetical protein
MLWGDCLEKKKKVYGGQRSATVFVNVVYVTLVRLQTVQNEYQFFSFFLTTADIIFNSYELLCLLATKIRSSLIVNGREKITVYLV